MVNYGIYESDIHYFNGRVDYSGEVISRNNRCSIEVAKVYVADSCADVYMKRFRDGSSVIDCFLKDGKRLNTKEAMGHLPATNWLKRMHNCFDNDEVFVEFLVFRKMKQYATLLMQIACLCAMIYVVISFLFSYITMHHILLGASSVIALCILGNFYKYYRLADPHDYKRRRDAIVSDDE